MVIWLFGGVWWTWDPGRPQVVGNTLLPWCCVLILGLVLFGAVSGGAIR
jgi:hypothetical protein